MDYLLSLAAQRTQKIPAKVHNNDGLRGIMNYIKMLINRYGLKKLLYHSSFLIVYGIFKYLPPPIGDVFRFMVLKVFIKEIHLTVWVKDGATFYFPENIKIGYNVTINEYVFINGYGTVEIMDNVRIGHRTSIISEDHTYSLKNVPIFKQEKIGKPIIIEDDVWIGCDVKILKGVKIGKGAVIGAGSVITKDVLPYTVVAGNPAKIIKIRGS